MPRKITAINKLIDAKQQELLADKEQLTKLKLEVQSGSAPSELVQKQINAMRATIANGVEDLDDLKAELKVATAYEASEAGVRKRAETREKLMALDAMVSVCVSTAADADRAANAHHNALRRHHGAHLALREALGAAYGAVVEGSGFDVHGDQAFLMMSWSNLSNSAPAIVEWLVESLRGYELDNFIQVGGMTLHHNQHETLQKADGLMLHRMWGRMKEVAQKLGHEVHADNDPKLDPLRQALLQAVYQAPLK